MKNYDLEHDWLDFVALQEKKQSNFFVIDDQTKEKIYHKNKKYFDSLLKYLKKELDITKSVKIILEEDEENSKKVLGRTGGYINQNWKIHIFVTGRHVKDILRSLSHEMVHHQQNIRGEFNGDQPTEKGYAQKNPHLRKMEKEAYLKGNMLFRDWEDNYKYKNKEERAKEVVKELKNILNNSRLLKEYEPDSAAMDRYVQTQSKYVAEKVKQAEAEERELKEYCRNAGINDIKCYEEGTFKWHNANCRTKYPGTRALLLANNKWRCVWESSNIKCPKTDKAGNLLDSLFNSKIGEWYCGISKENKPNTPNIYYNLTANSNEYSNAVEVIKAWTKENNLFFIENDDYGNVTKYIPNDFLKTKEIFLDMEPEFLQAARIIINDTNFKYYGYMLCDGENLWRTRKTKDDPENYHPIDSPFCKNGKEYYEIARSMVTMNTSSRQIIQAQDVSYGNPDFLDPRIFKQWLDSKLTWWTYVSEDWKKIVWLWKQGKYSEAAIVFLDTFSVFEPTGAADILQGIILIANGDVQNGLLCIGLGVTSTAMFAADLASAGVFTPAYVSARAAIKAEMRTKTEQFLGKLAYRSEGRILMLAGSKDAATRKVARQLAISSKRAALILENNLLKEGSEKEILNQVIGGKITPFVKADLSNFKSAYIEQLNVLKRPVVGATQAGFAGMTLSYQAEKAEELQRKDKEKKALEQTFKETCEEITKQDREFSCKYFELDPSGVPIVKKEFINTKEIEDVKNTANFVRSRFSRNLLNKGIRKNFPLL